MLNILLIINFFFLEYRDLGNNPEFFGRVETQTLEPELINYFLKMKPYFSNYNMVLNYEYGYKKYTILYRYLSANCSICNIMS